MTAIGEMIRKDAIEEGARVRDVEIAETMLKDGVGISTIAKYTGLSEDAIRELKEELAIA